MKNNITKQEAVKLSIKKWQKVIAGYEKCRSNKDWAEILDRLMNVPCGFCAYVELYWKHPPPICQCPLYPDICCPDDKYCIALYWRIIDKIEHESKKGLLAMLRRMLKEIETRGQKWLQE